MNIATQMNQKKSNERQESHQCTNPKCICPLGERPLAFEERPTWEPTTNVERCCVPHYKTV